MLRILLVVAALTGCGAPANADDGADTKTDATTSTDPGAATGRPVQPVPAFAERWRSMPDPATWHDAKAQAPEGCRLPARWELVKAFDAGEFERINTWTWTASEIGEEDAWLALFSNLLLLYPESRASKVHKLTKNFVIYICGEDVQ